MRASIPRLLGATRAARVSLGAPAPTPASGAACSGAPVGAGNAHLPPVRYHIFAEPLPYPVGLKLQQRVIDERLAARKTDPKAGKQDVLFLLEHTPTYTTGRRDNTPNPDELHPEEKKVQNVGAEFFITKRGGQVTYHGPGQLVGYPLLDLNAMETPTRCYVEYLQALLGEYATSLGLDVHAPHPDGHVGVFSSTTEKVASIGIHLRHRITSHGFSMNVTTEPKAWFDLVTACGLDDVHAVGLTELLARAGRPADLSVRSVAEALVPRFADTYQREFVPLSLDGDDEVRGIQRIVAETEAEAKEINAKAGGWLSKPDVSRQAAA
ncbi:hypothetical protein VHUM_02989 [Vanrija humicola]|uniref:lipoyl(octanoyl) transferase n=1 Tax=Vanrija humicola TaxID=5417 RepID=A0A7D8YVJ1_VANHU|nr:hypothetical protein VHUM_02989 [Vanrija humicola]